MKKRVLSALLVLCMACGLVSTAWAAGDQATPETTAAPETGDVVTVEPATPESAAPETDTQEAEAPEPDEDSQPVQAQGVPVEGGMQYTAQLEQDGQALNVIVTAPDGAFDGDAPTLNLSAIEDEAKLDAIAGELDGQVDYDGFAALDISFTDADDNEIEPNPDHPVTVRIELPDSIVDSGIDLTTLAVQHLAEDAEGNVTKVEQVASVADGTIALSDEAKAAMEAQASQENAANGVAPMMLAPAANTALTPDNADAEAPIVAEFTVDGFSYFVLTYRENDLRVSAVDENYDPIGNNSSDGYDLSTSWTDVETIAQWIIEGNNIDSTQYEFVRAEIHSYYSQEIHWLKYRNQYSNGGFRYSTTESQPNSSNNGQSVGSGSIYFVFREKDTEEPNPGGEGGGTVTQNATVTTGKTAVLRDDGNYDLTLSISGDRGSSSQKQQVDIVFILDKSGSMRRNLNNNNNATNGNSRMDLLQSSVSSLIDTIEANNGIDARYSAVAFAGDGGSNHGSTYTTGDNSGQEWRNAGGIKDFVKGLVPDGGTNYQRGIYEAKNLLESKRNGALTFVIFVSDGIPTYRGNDDDSGNGQSDSNNANINAAVTEIGGMNCNYFYAIGMGPDFGTRGQGRDLQGTTNLKSLAKAVNATTSKGDKNVFSASNTTDLQSAFNQITSSITFFAAKDVTITDPLSQYADIVMNANNQAEFTITVTRTALTDDETHEVTSPAQTWTTQTPVTNGGTFTFQDRNDHNIEVTAWYDDSGNGTITLDFPDDYELEPGYTYSISTVITPSQAAKDYIHSETNTDDVQTPDEGTGTHADKGEQGFWSNDNENAKVTYTANGEFGSENFPKPVIQVQKPQEYTLTVTKTVTGSMGSTGDTFNFVVTLTKEMATEESNPGTLTLSYSGSPSDASRPNEVRLTAQTGVDGSVLFVSEEFPLTSGETVEITIPYGYTAKLQEVGVEGTGYNTYYREVTEGVELGTGFNTDGKPITTAENNVKPFTDGDTVYPIEMTSDHSYQFANFRPAVAPTGLESNHTAPYTLMITAAGIAGLALIGSIVARRVRRRREE